MRVCGFCRHFCHNADKRWGEGGSVYYDTRTVLTKVNLIEENELCKIYFYKGWIVNLILYLVFFGSGERSSSDEINETGI